MERESGLHNVDAGRRPVSVLYLCTVGLAANAGLDRHDAVELTAVDFAAGGWERGPYGDELSRQVNRSGRGAGHRSCGEGPRSPLHWVTAVRSCLSAAIRLWCAPASARR